ncbi:Zn(II)2Cys6 transcription factor domain-containing protein [Aspergillus mulundensis]|uniref:Zn(2)-C6 fungal-type domain-containing protein n=1 Tax=Aspergillus mulundensis TaxID=1810919 RepID=A0A3D8RAE0_9EURO|nr:hypothetical protein DSM5745_08389 [Aspergillus mulundensis]RDW70878.1 hypothetical protein DSM5745_08389 [Aspergillus mulundensis]
MDSSSYPASKRPPKLRAACNECHAAKVRCSGEKTGCQRCSNLRLKCAFSISRIGKVPGKRSKANRGPATASTSSSASLSTSSSSLSTPIMTPPILTTAHSFESPRTYDGRSHVPIPAYSYPQDYASATGLPLASESTYAHSSPIYPTQSHPEDMSSLNNLCWTSELDPLSGGLLSPDWEIDGDDSLPSASASASSHPRTGANTTLPTYPDFASDGTGTGTGTGTSTSRNPSSSRTGAYASPAESLPPAQPHDPVRDAEPVAEREPAADAAGLDPPGVPAVPDNPPPNHRQPGLHAHLQRGAPAVLRGAGQDRVPVWAGLCGFPTPGRCVRGPWG